MILWCFELTVQLFLKGLPGIFLFVWAWGFLFCLFIFETGSLAMITLIPRSVIVSATQFICKKSNLQDCCEVQMKMYECIIHWQGKVQVLKFLKTIFA
jgi:hypothetical protein